MRERVADDFVLANGRSQPSAFRGGANFARMNEYPAHGFWQFRLDLVGQRARASSPRSRSPDGLQHATAISFFEVADGRAVVCSTTEPYPAHNRRHLVELIA